MGLSSIWMPFLFWDADYTEISLLQRQSGVKKKKSPFFIVFPCTDYSFFPSLLLLTLDGMKPPERLKWEQGIFELPIYKGKGKENQLTSIEHLMYQVFYNKLFHVIIITTL